MATKRTNLFIGALLLAAIAVIGVVTIITGSWPASQPEEVALVTEVSPTPTPDMSRITPEAAVSTDTTYESPAVAGVSMTAETGPNEIALAAIFGTTLLGLGGSLFLAKFA